MTTMKTSPLNRQTVQLDQSPAQTITIDQWAAAEAPESGDVGAVAGEVDSMPHVAEAELEHDTVDGGLGRADDEPGDPEQREQGDEERVGARREAAAMQGGTPAMAPAGRR